MIPALARDAAKEYLRDPARDREAARVERLAAAFVRYEMHPPQSGKALGRYSPVALNPPVGTVLHKKLSRPDADMTRGVERAVTRTVAVGYALFASLGPSFEEEGMDAGVVEDRELEPMWAFWVSNFNTGYVGKLTAPAFSEVLHDVSVDEFLIGLNEADAIPRLGKRTRLNLLGATYGQAGATLRYVQTGVLSDDWLHGDPFTQVTMHWPLDYSP